MVKSTAYHLHENIPPGYYRQGIRRNLLQKIWHTNRFGAVSDFVMPTRGEILDIGCADGTFSQVILEKTGAEKLVGIDVVDHLIADDQQYFKNNGKMEFLVADAHNLPFADGTFDAVFALEVLEHVENPRQVLSEVKRVLKPDGYIVILVPNETLLFKIEWWLFRTFGPAKIWNDTHIQEYSKNTLLKMVTQAGFAVVRQKRFNLGTLEIIQAKPF
ncbi:class I SAM-dependent methyltransferase [Candidatus Daviesbacteria bacterium]|nr:class I SAM-dependent methyltransferase [Candidatus Daviesbacteria bacterium]